MFYVLAVLIYVVRKSRNKEQLLDHLFEHLKEIIIKYSKIKLYYIIWPIKFK